jgi:hypothetical protein
MSLWVGITSCSLVTLVSKHQENTGPMTRRLISFLLSSETTNTIRYASNQLYYIIPKYAKALICKRSRADSNFSTGQICHFTHYRKWRVVLTGVKQVFRNSYAPPYYYSHATYSFIRHRRKFPIPAHMILNFQARTARLHFLGFYLKREARSEHN